MNTTRKQDGAAVPDGWQMVKLGDVARIDTGGTPSRDVLEYWDGDIPWMASAEINQSWVTDTAERISEKGLSNSNAKVFPAGTVMVAMNGQGATRGKTAILGIDSTCNQSLAAIRAEPSTCNAFIYHVLSTGYEKLRGLTGEGRNGLNLELIRGFRFVLPPLPEQRAIADVLDSIDDAIERTESVIAATETLRDSLLHELLTRGVPGWHTEWKDVPGIGTIPADWEVVRLGEVIQKFEYGTSVQCNSDPTGVPVLRIPNIASGELDLTELKYANLSTAEMEKLRLAPGDVLLVRTNGNPEICGTVVGYGRSRRELGIRFLYSARATRPISRQPRIRRALHEIRSWTSVAQGSHPHFGRKLQSQRRRPRFYPFPCPALAEQEWIVDSVGSSTKLLESLRSGLWLLNLTKSATANVLLSGQNRLRARTATVHSEHLQLAKRRSYGETEVQSSKQH